MAPSSDSPAPWSLPDPIPTRLETPRVVIRTFEPADAAALWIAVDESRPSLHPWLPWALSDNRSIAETHHTIERFRRDLNRASFDAGKLALAVGIFDGVSGRLLGGTSFHAFRPQAGQAEIGYWIRTSERGRGVCVHAAAAMISWAFTPQALGGWSLRRIEIICASGNGASAGVCRSLGIREESRTHADRWVDGRGWDDTLKFGVVLDDWDIAARALRGKSRAGSVAAGIVKQ